MPEGSVRRDGTGNPEPAPKRLRERPARWHGQSRADATHGRPATGRSGQARPWRKNVSIGPEPFTVTSPRGSNRNRSPSSARVAAEM